MDQNGVASYRHRRSPSSDRFLGVFSPPSSEATISASPSAAAGDELNEDDVFYTNDFSEPQRSTSSTLNHRFPHSFRRPEKFGILAALPENRRNADVIVQKPAISSSPTTSFSRDIPSIPKPHSSLAEIKYSQSMPMRRFQQSAPMNVPMMRRKPLNEEVADVDGGDEDEEVLPPHEIVARGSFKNQNTTFSVLEGAGRTLKGRDLWQISDDNLSMCYWIAVSLLSVILAMILLTGCSGKKWGT
ncbi:hypothetical protein BUALT_Bualt11G0092900 [Buddleja alternifolia]|uniref:Uncharacterized protein n=1 Tax=Buddleja alternifolia TaxID=168488 RepID=A0AAV6WV35_9LAMI|nr:hypothetical protein BUALT_Bualt11G0092900 [Buddleja alternifolia]